MYIYLRGCGTFQVRFFLCGAKLLSCQLVHDIFQPVERRNTPFALESMSHGLDVSVACKIYNAEIEGPLI